MTRITIEIDRRKASILKEKARKFGLSTDQFVVASINDLISKPDPEFETAMERVLSKNRKLYDQLA